jgi:hypothetical protein
MGWMLEVWIVDTVLDAVMAYLNVVNWTKLTFL